MVIILNMITIKSIEDKSKKLTIEEYFDIIRPYLSDIINNHKTQGEWKINSSNTLIGFKTRSE